MPSARKGMFIKMNNTLGLIGLAKRAGKLSAGEFLCERAIKGGQAKLTVIASDISDNARKKITDACKFYGVKCVEFASSGELGKSIGADSRMVVCINDENFSNAILSKIERIDE